MKRIFKSNRLPKGVSIYLNTFDEYVAVENDKVAQIDNKNIRMDITLDGAINNYLNKKVS